MTNQYENEYNNLIQMAVERGWTRDTASCYTERHHIVPRCMDGSDDDENLVYLTAQEHYEAHRLLAHVYPFNVGLQSAYTAMAFLNNRGMRSVKITPDEYADLQARKSYTTTQRNRKFSDEEEVEICRSYTEDCMDGKEIAELWGVCTSCIHRLLNRHGVKTRYSALTDSEKDEIVKIYTSEYIAVKHLAKRLGFGKNSVSSVLKERNVELRTMMCKLSPEEESKLVKEYVKDSSVTAKFLAKKYKINSVTVRLILDRHNIKPRSNSNGIYHTPNGSFASSTKAGRANGCYHKVVVRRCKNADVKIKAAYGLKKEWIGKTWRELGWWFESKSTNSVSI